MTGTRLGRRSAAVLVLAVTASATAGVTLSDSATADSVVTFVQSATVHGTATSKSVALPGPVTVGNRLIVEVGVWGSAHPTAKTVTDSLGNAYTEVLHAVASDGTEQSLWTAPVTTAGAAPTVKVAATAKADIGAAVLEYAGLSSAAGSGAVDVSQTATGTAATASTVNSGATAAVSGSGIALGLYDDSGFGTTPTPTAGFTKRAAVTGAKDIDLLVADEEVGAGDTPNAGATTAAGAVWLISTVVFKSAAASAPTAPGVPTNVTASAEDSQAVVSWTAPSSGGSTITSYTVTPYAGLAAGTPVTVTGSPAPTTETVTGLTNGTAYTFTVQAMNAVGSGPVSAASNSVTPSPMGSWGQLMSWPLVAIQNIALANGKYLVIDGWQTPQPTKVWDPTTNTFTDQVAPGAVFCSGSSHLPDGRIITAGGYGALGIKTTAIFDPTTETWTKAADMHYQRWYPSLLQLADGRYLVLSGNSTDANHWSDTPEIYDPSTDTWTVLTGVKTSGIHEEEYPFTYLMPNGKVFAMGPEEDHSYVLDVDAKSLTSIGSSGVLNGSSVMYRPGKILYSGGAASVTDTTPAQSNTSVIDLNAASPKWRATAPMNKPRVYHTLTMLADGKVLAVGGGYTSDQYQVTTGELSSEIWDPATEKWTLGPSMSAARTYHSTAVLMPDGRVLVAGGGHMVMENPEGQFNAQIYSPPYLSSGHRPTITAASESTNYGGAISVATPDASDISAVNLVSLGSDTHQADMGQHFVPLDFTAGDGTLSVNAPATSAIAPSGDYMMFIVDKQGVPSVASMVHLVAPGSTVPGVPSGVRAVPGDGRATVSWAAPTSGGSPVTSYTVTPYAGTTTLPPITVQGSFGTPPATSAKVTGLVNGTAYTFTVSATNGVGTGATSSPSAAVTPSTVPPVAVVQQATSHGNGATRPVPLAAGLTAGDRMVVEAGVWGPNNQKAQSVTDTAGDTYTEVLKKTASDGTEQSIWTAPISTTTSTPPTVTVKSTSGADVGVSALEYSGLSTASGAGAIDVTATSTGTSSGAKTIYSGATNPASGSGLAIGFYTDSGFGTAPGPSNGWTAESSIYLADDIDLLVEDLPVASGATPNAGAYPNMSATWIMSTVVFRTAASTTGAQPR